MLYKPYGFSGACENSVNFLIVVFYENHDAAQMSPLKCERDRDIDEYGRARSIRTGDGDI
jgi:hypothetical protein